MERVSKFRKYLFFFFLLSFQIVASGSDLNLDASPSQNNLIPRKEQNQITSQRVPNNKVYLSFSMKSIAQTVGNVLINLIRQPSALFQFSILQASTGFPRVLTPSTPMQLTLQEIEESYSSLSNAYFYSPQNREKWHDKRWLGIVVRIHL